MDFVANDKAIEKLIGNIESEMIKSSNEGTKSQQSVKNKTMNFMKEMLVNLASKAKTVPSNNNGLLGRSVKTLEPAFHNCSGIKT